MAQHEIPTIRSEIWKDTKNNNILPPDNFVKSFHAVALTFLDSIKTTFDELQISAKNEILTLMAQIDHVSTPEEKTFLNLKRISENIVLDDDKVSNLVYSLLQQIFFYNYIRFSSKSKYNLLINPLLSKSLPYPKHCLQEIQTNISKLRESFEFAPIFQIPDKLIKFLSFFGNSDLYYNIIKVNSNCEILDYKLLQSEYFSEFIQQLIPIHAQKSYGQIYTPYQIAKLMANLVITDSKQKILDPACGCGVLLTESYKKLSELKEDHYAENQTYIDTTSYPSFHEEILKQIWGVEIHSYPAHLSMLQLAMMDLSSVTSEIGVFTEDFLALGPIQKYMVKTQDLKTGKVITREIPTKFDVIIANPPYIKQEKIPHKQEMMKRLPIYAAYRKKNVFLDNLKEIPKKITLDISGKSDLYGFFLWYSTFFLKSHGTLCFLIPDKWMDVKYGEKIKKFLKEHYCIKNIIGFNQNLFKHAQVSSVLLIAEKNENINARKTNIVKFTLVNRNSFELDDFSKIKSIINEKNLQKLNEQGYIFENNGSTLHSTYIYQENLNVSEKWTYKYLFQSLFNLKLCLANSILLNNNVYTSVVGGLKTGANDFFFPTIELQEKYQIETQFLKPGIKSGRNLPKNFLISSNPNSFLSIPSETNLADYPGMESYIKWCEKEHKFHQRPSVKWKPWYSIPQKYQIAPDILFLRHINDDFEAKWNKNQCMTADGIRGISIHNPDNHLFFLGILNSKFFYWQAHVEGRWEGQGDFQLLVYELKNFKIPDISKLSDITIQNVNKAIKNLLNYKMSRDKEKHQNLDKFLKKRHSLQKTLDIAVLACFNLSQEYDLMMNELKWLENKRLTKKII